MGLVGARIGEPRHLLVEPARALVFLEIRLEPAIDVAQVRDVAQRVRELLLRQRPSRPVREARGLVEVLLCNLLDEVDVAHRFAEAAHHGGDLGVEDRMRDEARQVPDDLQILPRGVKHLHHALVGHQSEEGLEGDAGVQGIDQRLVLGAGELDEAQPRPVGLLAYEFRVDGHEVVLAEPLAELGELVGGGDQAHGRGLIAQPLALVAQNARIVISAAR